MPVQKFRDVSKYLTVMEDDSAAYLLLGIENQSAVNYAMPVRNMVYDALQYAAQVEQVAKIHRESMKKANKRVGESKEQTSNVINGGEYLTGFYRNDKLLSAITLVVFFSADEWDGPMSLHEMLSVRDEKILPFVPDYRINLVAPAAMSDEEIAHFTTSLKEVMLFLKYSQDKEKLAEVVNTDEGFKNLDQKAMQVIQVVTGESRLKFNNDEEVVNVCKAIEDMWKDANKEGERDANLATAKKLLQLGKLSLEEIADSTHLPIEEVAELWKNIQE